MTVRRYQEADIPDILKMIEFALSVTQFKDIHFSKDKMGDLLTGNVRNNMFFGSVAIDGGNIVGGICGRVRSFIFSHEIMVEDLFFFVFPDKRGKQAATELVEAYVTWAKERRPRRIQLSNSMGVEIDKFAEMAEHLGFKKMGTVHQMSL